MFILAGIASLVQYVAVESLECPSQCPNCGRPKPWRHGTYPRKTDRESGELNPILIHRFYCPNCKQTCSVLPACIPPHRWYLWTVQQTALALFLSGRSLNAIAQTLALGRRTVSRWLNRFKNRFLVQADVLRNHKPELGRTTDFHSFWKSCLDKLSLAEAMRICHVSGVSIP